MARKGEKKETKQKGKHMPFFAHIKSLHAMAHETRAHIVIRFGVAVAEQYMQTSEIGN